MKEVKVISLGGSLIAPEKIDLNFIKEFKKVINNNKSKYKFIIICGGGTTARKYIHALKDLGLNEKLQSFIGISATRINARFMSYIFGFDPESGMPNTLHELEKYVKRQEITFCGALEYEMHQTSDSTAAEIARHFKTDFINMTDVSGLHDKNPKEYKNAKFIPEISWEGLFKMANKNKFKPGQHFVIDQSAAEMIMNWKIVTYIIGKSLRQLDNLLNGRKFIGTVVKG